MRQKLEDNKHIVDLLFVMSIFLFFTISALFLILVGSRVYRNTVEKMDTNFDSRTSFAYLTEKIRKGDVYDSIETGEFDGCKALILKEDIEGRTYATYIYLYDGSLRELFTSTDNSGLTAEAGQAILEVKDFQIEEVGESLFKVSVTPPSGTPYDFHVSRLSGSLY